jgi:hypothetical protein
VAPAKIQTAETLAKTQATVVRAPVRRAAKAVRIRRAPTTVAAQATYQYAQTQAAYQWTDPNVQASQTARRVVVKRHHAVKKTAPPAQSSLTDSGVNSAMASGDPAFRPRSVAGNHRHARFRGAA